MCICLCSQNTGYKASTEGRVHSEHNLQRARSYSSWDRNARGGSQTRKTAPGNENLPSLILLQQNFYYNPL